MPTDGTVLSIRQLLCAHRIFNHSRGASRVEKGPGREHMSAIDSIRGQGGTHGRDMSRQRVVSRPRPGTRPSLQCLVSIEVMQEPTPEGRRNRCHFVPRRQQGGLTLSHDTTCHNPMLKAMSLGGMLTNCKICIEVQWRRFDCISPAFFFRVILMRCTDTKNLCEQLSQLQGSHN